MRKGRHGVTAPSILASSFVGLRVSRLRSSLHPQSRCWLPVDVAHRASCRRSLLTAALGFLQLPLRTPALRAVHSWRNNWRGIGHIVIGMDRHCFRLSLKKYGDGAGAPNGKEERVHVAMNTTGATTPRSTASS